MELGVGETLVSGLTIPPSRFGVILRHTLAVFQHTPKNILRLVQPLISGPTKPVGRLGIVLGYAPSIGVHTAKVILSLSVA